MTGRRGFALLAVLWLVAAVTTLAGTSVHLARSAGSVSSNRIALARARWAAEGCVAVAQAELDSALRTAAPLAVPKPRILTYANGAECRVAGYEPSARLNADSATREMRARFDSALVTFGVRPPRESLLTMEGDGRIDLNTAPAVVLAALPAFGPEAVREALERRRFGPPIGDLFDLLARLSPPAREALVERYGEVARRVTFTPQSLLLTATGRVRGLAPTATIEVLIVSAGSRAAVVRRRMW